MDTEDPKAPQSLSGAALDITILAEEIEFTDGSGDETEHILSEETIPAVKEQNAEVDQDAEDGANPDEPYVHEIVRVDRKTWQIFKDRQTVIYINCCATN